MDLSKLVEISTKNPSKVTIEATVTTGLESVAFKECQAKFANLSEICKSRGRIYFNVDISQIYKVHAMRSIDNIFVVADIVSNIEFTSDNMSENNNILKSQTNRPDWLKLLMVWKTDQAFQGISYPTEKQHKHSLEIEKELKLRANLITNHRKEVEPTIDYDPDKRSNRKLTPQRISEIARAKHKSLVTKVYNEVDIRNPSEKVLKYRVTCYRSGKHTFGSQDAAQHYGGELQDKFNWIVDLELFDLEIVLSIKSNDMYVCLALTQESKHRRNIHHFGPTTLRATICYNLLHLGEPHIGDIVMDPMCGGGSIPIEGMLAWPGTYHIGGDTHPKAIARCNGNVKDLDANTNYIDIAAWDVTNLPLRDHSVDLVVIDLPFGRRSGCKKDNRVLYKQALSELARVVCVEQGRAVLLTEDKRSFIMASSQMNEFWTLKKTLCVNMGGLNATVFVLQRTMFTFIHT